MVGEAQRACVGRDSPSRSLAQIPLRFCFVFGDNARGNRLCFHHAAGFVVALAMSAARLSTEFL